MMPTCSAWGINLSGQTTIPAGLSNVVAIAGEATSVDPDGVALAAIQGLNQKAETRMEKLEAENAALKARLEKLERRLDEQSNRPR